MKRILASLIARPIGVSLVLIVVAVLGVLSLWRIPLAAMPTLLRPVVRAQAAAPGESMDRLEADLARRLEENLMSLPGTDSVTTWCRDGMVAAEVAYRWGIQEEKARLRVAEAVESLTSSNMPLAWQVTVVDPMARPALLITVEGSLPEERRALLAEEVLMPQFAALPGIGRIEILGGARERTIVRPDPRKMAGAGLTLGDIREALERKLPDRQIGEVVSEGDRLEVVAQGCEHEPGAVAALTLFPSAGAALPLGDVAAVGVEPWSEHGVLRVGGRPAVGLAMYLIKGANAMDVGHQVNTTLASLEQKLPEGVRLVRAVDEAAELRRALLGLLFAGLVGTIIEGLILVLFVRRMGALIVLIAVTPLCLLASLPIFEALGLNLNLVSLAGISLALGMLVDASVVVLDASLRRHGEARRRAVEGTAEVARAILASVVTTAVVFIPALYLRHLAAALFRELAVAIMVTLMVSLVFALLAVPVAAAYLASERHLGESAMTRAYRRLLTRLMADGRWTLPLVAGVLIILAVLFIRLPQHLLPPEARTALEIQFTLPPLSPGPDIRALQNRLGPALEPFRRAAEKDICAVEQESRSGPPLPRGFWRLPADRDLRELQRIRQALSGMSEGLCVTRVGPVGGVLDALPLRLLSVDISGPRREDLVPEADRISGLFQKAGIQVLTDLPARQSRVVFEPTLLGRQQPAGLEDAIARILPLSEPFAVGAVRLDESLPTLADLEGTPVTFSGGRKIPLGSLVRFRSERAPPVLVRHQGEAAVRLLLGDVTGEVSGIERLIGFAKNSLPKGFNLKASGGILDWQEARGELKLAFALGLLLIFLVILATYESFRLTLVVFTVLPFAVLGGVLALKISGQGLDLASGLGFLLLCGLAVNNGILLVDQLQGCPGGPARWAMHAARRLRPVLITTGTTLATLGPVAFMGGTGASLRATLALTVFAGLLVSTLTALFVCPAMARMVLRKDEGGRQKDEG
jgi:multidrug efflux pump subunit AcrB